MGSGSWRTAVLVLSLAALATVILRDPTESAVPHASPVAPAGPAGAAATTAEAAVRAATDPGPERLAAGGEPPPAAAEPALQVRLRGLHPQAPWTAPLRLRIKGDAGGQRVRHEASGDLAGDRCVLPMPKWLDDAPQADGRIEADDPCYEPLRHAWEGSLALDRELVLDVQAVAILAGRVVSAQGEPVAAARVLAFACRDGAPTGDRLATTNTRDDGHFRLRVPGGTQLFVTAVPMHAAHISGMRLTGADGAIADDGTLRDDLLPAATRAAGTIGKETGLPDFVLNAACRLTGTVRWRDGTPVAGATIVSMPRDGLAFAVGDEHGVRLHANGTLSPSTRARADEQGAFALPAVPGAEVDVAVMAIPGATVVDEWPAQATVAPQRVEFALPLPVRLRAMHGGVAVKRAVVEIRIGESGRWPEQTTGDDGALLLLTTQPSLRVRARHGHLSSPWLESGAADAGRTLEFELAPVLTEVSVEFEGELRVRNATLAWRRDDGREGREHGLRDDRGGPFQLFLEPGRYRLRIGPGGGERNGRFLLPIERDVEVAGEPVRLVLPAAFGGNFVLHATDASGLYVAGACRVRDAAGQDVTDRFVVRSEGGARVGESGEVLDGGPNEFARMLAPGDYTLECDFVGHGVRRLAVEIKPRDTAAVRIRL